MDVASFADIEQEFHNRVSKIVWCTLTTVDRKGRPRTRIVHPFWEGSTGYVLTGRHSFKTKHLDRNPYVSAAYWSAEHGLVVADCRTSWEEAPAEKARIFRLFKETPPPYGYDPALFGMSHENPESGVLVLTPWRVELHGLTELMQQKPPLVWRG